MAYGFLFCFAWFCFVLFSFCVICSFSFFLLFALTICFVLFCFVCFAFLYLRNQQLMSMIFLFCFVFVFVSLLFFFVLFCFVFLSTVFIINQIVLGLLHLTESYVFLFSTWYLWDGMFWSSLNWPLQTPTLMEFRFGLITITCHLWGWIKLWWDTSPLHWL